GEGFEESIQARQPSLPAAFGRQPCELIEQLIALEGTPEERQTSDAPDPHGELVRLGACALHRIIGASVVVESERMVTQRHRKARQSVLCQGQEQARRLAAADPTLAVRRYQRVETCSELSITPSFGDPGKV